MSFLSVYIGCRMFLRSDNTPTPSVSSQAHSMSRSLSGKACRQRASPPNGRYPYNVHAYSQTKRAFDLAQPSAVARPASFKVCILGYNHDQVVLAC